MANFGFYASIEAIRRSFIEHKMNWKTISKVAIESDAVEVALFWRMWEVMVPVLEMAIWGDESYRSDVTANPRKGRGRWRVYVKVKFTRGGYKYSLLMFQDINGVVAHKIFFGAVDEELFNDWIVEHLARHLNVYGLPRSVVVIDNVPFHHNDTLFHIIDTIGAVLVHLPRYMPLLNLAEQGFRDIKAIERSKCIYGELEGLLSLNDSVLSIKNKNYRETLREMGYE